MTFQLSTTDWITLVLVIITAIYAWTTFKILRANQAAVNAMQKQTEAQLRPYVVVAVIARTGTTLLLLEIQNTGKSPAEKLRLVMDKDFFQNADQNEHKNLKKQSAFAQIIECLAPGAKLQFVLGVGSTVLNTGIKDAVCPRVFSIDASYSFAGKAYSEKTSIDLHPFMNSVVIHDPVADEVEKLRKSLEKLLAR